MNTCPNLNLDAESKIVTKRAIERLETKIEKLDTRLVGEMTLIKRTMGIVIATEAMPSIAKPFA